MVLISQNGDVYNFDNVVCVRQQGCYIHVQKSFGAEIPLAVYDTEDRAKEVLEVPHGTDCAVATYDTEERTKEVMENFVSELNDTPFTMATRYAFPTE